MADTFQQLVGEVRLYAPGTPLPLAQKFVRDAYRRTTSRFSWAGQRAESAFVVPAPYITGTVSVTQNNASVTGASTVWTSAMVGRQLVVSGRAPFYTIATFVSTTSITLDRVYAGTTGSDKTYEIVQVYMIAPSDLIRLDSVLDPDNWLRLRLNWTQEQLDSIDPERSNTSAGPTPRAVAAASFSSTGVPRYELWPRPTGAKSYPVRYTKRLADLSANSDTPIEQIRGDVLRYGALAQLALWPGTAESPNPFHSLDLHKEYETLFQREIDYLERLDQEIRMDSLSYDDGPSPPFFPIDARFMQSHAPY